MTVTIIYEDEDIVVIDKPAGMPSAPLKKRTDAGSPEAVRSAVECLCEICPAVRSVSGHNEREYGLVHRIDTDTRGVLLAAKNRKAFDFLMEEQRGGRFEKTYLAFVAESRTRKEGFPPEPANFFREKTESRATIFCESGFRAWGRGAKEVRPVPKTSGGYAKRKAGKTLYETSIRLEKLSIENLLNIIQKYTQNDGLSLETLSNSLQNHNFGCPFLLENLSDCMKNHTVFAAECRLVRGFRHQVRAHLAWCGFPVIGDRVYGAETGGGQMLFFAVRLSFRHPTGGNLMEAGIG
jgi:23S rRNA pseudouridine1911/1915/1917 synthase